MRISLILCEHLPQVWPQVEAYMARAADFTNGRCLADDIRNWLFEESQHLWIAFDDAGKIHGAATTKIVQYPLAKVLSIEFVGGNNLADWKSDMLAMLERFAVDEGCSALQGVGRRGWARELVADGWKQMAVVCEKELNDVRR